MAQKTLKHPNGIRQEIVEKVVNPLVTAAFFRCHGDIWPIEDVVKLLEMAS